MRRLILLPSPQVPSHTNPLPKYLTPQFHNHHLHLHIFHLAQTPLNQLHFSPTTHSTHQIKPNTKHFQHKPIQPHFLIFPTPNYHPSYSPILKNPLHHINIHYLKIKPVGLIPNT
ncbi:NAD(P)H-dependent oxidoreductase, partial [Staphylococcus hominis]|uniref:NAD(P)H-dependent oxidoreductase n=1 Tax=Staphylococcus hominis TaxID=1290 RepID=UPI0016436D02